PSWLRFVRLVVDSADIPLNMSREMAQQSPIIGQIKQAVTSRVAQELVKLAENDAEKFAEVWDNFGAVIKEGLHEDPSRRDDIFKIARFASTRAADKTRALKDYVADLRENQTAIFYAVGDDRKRLGQSPHLEEFAARGVEVLLLDDAVDAFWVTSCLGFDGKPFKSVTQGAADISLVPMLEGKEAPAAAEHGTEVAALVQRMNDVLREHVAEVRVSTRLRDSAVCLIAPEHGLDRRLARLLAEHGQPESFVKPVLEINPRHPAITALFDAPQDERTTDAYLLLLDAARIADGEEPVDAAAFVKRLAARLTPEGARA
ncbi:MAG TPA: molecular chaperone HtpG, partial [Methylocystis sp.]|nr:molecular chaperone HtpG [Methylocystis sp.]